MSWPDSMAIICVDWLDSYAVTGWHQAEDMRAAVTTGQIRCRSVGYLFVDQEDRLVLLGDQNENGQVSAAMTIPRVAVTNVTVLREAGS